MIKIKYVLSSYRPVNYWLRVFCVLAFAKALLSCNSSNHIEEEIANIPIDAEMYLFHQEFAQSEAADLEKLRQQYPLLISERVPDSVYVAKMMGKDTIQNILESEVKKAQFNYDKIEKDVKDIMRHVSYYFPDFKETDIITFISEVEYDYQVVPRKDGLYIAIDTYLGVDSELYLGISKYIRNQLKIEKLPADVALAYAKLFVPKNMERSLLENMIYHGKLHYVQKLFVPEEDDELLFGYTTEKYKFTVNNEQQMWRYLIDEELLYDTDSSLLTRFILPAPFSKFYLEVDQETPGGVGRYLGYRIVQAYMSNNNVSIDAMLATPAEELFRNSKYKPE